MMNEECRHARHEKEIPEHDSQPPQRITYLYRGQWGQKMVIRVALEVSPLMQMTFSSSCNAPKMRKSRAKRGKEVRYRILAVIEI